MKVSSEKVKRMEKDLNNLIMEISILENIKIMKRKGVEYWYVKMEIRLTEHGLEENFMAMQK